MRVALQALLAGMLLAAASAASADADEAALWKRLREGGYVLFIRHAETVPGMGDPAGYKLDDCATQRNLSDEGRDHAKRMGARFKKERVHVERVYSSPWCRCRDTGTLAFGKSEDWSPLSSIFDFPDRETDYTERVKKRVSQYGVHKPKGNVVMVTHNVNIAALTKLSVAQGEIVVVRPDGCCSFKVVGRLKV
ncbi:histidine phosphatase family protein [Usitatibacter palustris]|uniref:Histidine phosphatase family protein n=1 Tax=Usitatibacter palustris TaxID=2732487 RepID=A0A6M4HC14_9PROT|nr:histidine phosphatase family protein [Usitatibacter palustris]QJR16143.1 hypothetical protein DSM104440_02972 [Usitatibacter palustris]